MVDHRAASTQGQSAICRVQAVADHDPATLPACDGFGWTGILTDRQRREMQQESLVALATPPDDTLGFTLTGVLDSDWRVAELLLGRPEFAASVSPEWKVSQFWFWGAEWQAGEREADEALAAGRHGTVYLSDEAFLASLAARPHAHL